MNVLYFLLCVAGGLAILVYTYPIVRLFGHLDWAEKYLGPGGTYLAWKLIGLAGILFGFYLLRYG